MRALAKGGVVDLLAAQKAKARVLEVIQAPGHVNVHPVGPKTQAEFVSRTQKNALVKKFLNSFKRHGELTHSNLGMQSLNVMQPGKARLRVRNVSFDFKIKTLSSLGAKGDEPHYLFRKKTCVQIIQRASQLWAIEYILLPDAFILLF